MAKLLYKLADCAVKCEVEQQLSALQLAQEEIPQMDELSEALRLDYG